MRASFHGAIRRPGGGGSPVTTDYSNPGGTGDRRKFISAVTSDLAVNGLLVKMIDGTTSGDSGATAMWFSGAQAVSGKYVKYQFTEAQVIQEIKWYQQTTQTHGTWKAQGSNDDSAWTDIGSSFTLGGATTQTITELSANATRYLYYRLLGISGSTTDPWIYEVEFKISPTARTNGCLYSNTGGMGDRTASITVTASSGLINAAASVTNLVDGSFVLDNNGSTFFQAFAAVSGAWIKFDFGSSKLIDEAAWYQDSSHSHDTWKWQGSPDDSAWTDIGSTFTLTGTVDPAIHSQLNGNAVSYRYYRLLGTGAGTVSNSPWLVEIEFRIA